MRAATVSEFICVSLLLCLECIVSLVISIPTASQNISASSSTSLREGLDTYNPFGLCIYFHLIQEEASLMMVDQDADLWVQQKVVRSHYISIFFFSSSIVFHFPLGPQPIQFQFLGHLSSFGHRFYLMKWALNPVRQQLVNPTSFMPLFGQCTMQAGYHCRSRG